MGHPQPTLCYITDRRALEPRHLLPAIFEAIEGGIDMIQIREKDAGARQLLSWTEAAVGRARSSARGAATRVMVNDRLDVALAADAGGVHVGGTSMPVAQVRTAFPATAGGAFWIGVSCHSPGDVMAAESAGADYTFLGPIFETASKLRYGLPLGLDALREAARQTHIPLLALGGITLDRVGPCLEAGATGIAGISIFQEASSIRERVHELRARIAAVNRAGELGASSALGTKGARKEFERRNRIDSCAKVPLC
jgi:thiamine-phosphate pyrophosphorylase